MNRPPTHAPRASDGLSRRSSGLSDAHRALIKLLAEVAVADFLCESEMTHEAAPAEDHEEVTR